MSIRIQDKENKSQNGLKRKKIKKLLREEEVKDTKKATKVITTNLRTSNKTMTKAEIQTKIVTMIKDINDIIHHQSFRI